MKNTKIIINVSSMLTILFIIVVVLLLLLGANQIHKKNVDFAEQIAQDCKDTGGVPETSNTWTNLNFKVTCKQI
ncbi:hypothetical protein SAMN04487970_10692 [Paenibacillus tianmuensis]|uniref:Uncharacterized protein n=1 Tax=Paenibacillus tianmuensis TaxID=624147 RepID=A0A1G4TUL1_9BACL|nr:hypothetical protein [Paenibacillus tianmuensis]SCW85034.1 hypothetical protein SAMN04487970_10692 [Paenibacillus tianmuensis]